MAPKPKNEAPKSKKKKPLTEEEKKAKADFAALQASEMVKKKIRDRRAAIKKTMFEEEHRSKMSMLKIHKEWRKIMRVAKVKDLRKDIVWLSAKHVHQVELKDKTIENYCKTLDESEAQHRSAQVKHLSMLDVLIDLHYMRTKKMEEEFQGHLKRLEEEFMTERALMSKTHDEQRKELKDMIAAMKTEFDEAIGEKRQEFESSREELKNKNTEDYNVLKISLESGIEELERRIEHTHQTYIASTEAKTVSFKALVAKDAITARIIEQRMRKLIRLHETLAYWRVRMATNSKEWEIHNKTVRDEKDRLNNHYIYLKRQLDRLHISEHQKLKAISRHVMEARKELKKMLHLGERVQLLAKYNSRLETEHEKIFPFDPLHCSTIPTVPGMRLDEEMGSGDQSPKGSVKLAIEEHPHMMVPRARVHSLMGLELPVPSQYPPEPGCDEQRQCHFHWASYCVDDTGEDVEETDYMIKFNKRYNKACTSSVNKIKFEHTEHWRGYTEQVMLDKLANEMERNKLADENKKLSNALRNYLDGLTITERMKTGYNGLINVNKKPNSPRASPPPPYVPPAPRAKKAE